MPKNILESVKWVLKFLNLRSTPGEPNINKLPESERKLKRPPLPPKEMKQCYPTLDDFKHFFIKEGIPPLKGEELLLENGKPISSLDSKLFDKRPKNNSETGYYAYYDKPPIEFGLYILILERVWCELLRILSNMVYGTKTYENDGRGYESLLSYMRNIRNLYDDCLNEDKRRFEGTEFGERVSLVINSIEYEKPLPHYGMLPMALYARVLDLKINHEELRSRLRQCKYCGTFRISGKKKGKTRKIFCGETCERKFNAPSREDNKKCVSKLRADNKKFQQKEDYNNLINWLESKEGYTPKEAAEKARKLIYKYGETFKNYKRKAIQKYGIS